MDSPKGIASRLRRTMHGPMWHGPSVLEAIGELSAVTARSYPIRGAHSVWELVLHIAAWAEIPLARLDGTPWLTPATHEDFPPVPAAADAGAGASEWTAAKQRAILAYDTLADRVKELTPAQLDGLVVGQDYSIATMLNGVVEHGVYHAGQILLLRRAAR
jgi:uncharacterized damage-inducible protein DinB